MFYAGRRGMNSAYGLRHEHFTEPGFYVAQADFLVLPQDAELGAVGLFCPEYQGAIPGNAAGAEVVVFAERRVEVAAGVALDFDAHTAARMDGGIKLGPERANEAV